MHTAVVKVTGTDKKLEVLLSYLKNPIKLTISLLFEPLHWLPIQQRIQYKINTISAKNVSMCTALSYLCDCLQLYTPSHTLHSASHTLNLQIPRTRLSTVGSHTFAVFSPATWNDLPFPLQQKPSLDSFKCNLKTFLFPKL